MGKKSYTGNNDQKIPENFIVVFSGTVRRLRKEKSISQYDLARLSGISWRMISDIERGVKQPTLLSLMKLAKGLDTSISRLIKEFIKDMGSKP